MNLIQRYSLWIGLLMLAFPAFAQVVSKPFVLKMGLAQVDLVPYALVLEDSTGQLTWEQVKNMPFSSPTENRLYFPHHNNRVYWVKIAVANPYEVPLARFLEIRNSTVNRISQYITREGKLIETIHTGDAQPYSTRPVQSNYFIFPIDLPASQTTEILLRIDTESDAVNLPLVLWESQSLLENAQRERWIFGLFYGVLLFTIIFHLFLFYKLNDTAVIYYIGYVVGVGGFMLSMDGLASQYLFPDFPQLANSLLPFSALFGGLCLMIFSYKYLGKENLARWAQISLAFIGVLCILLMPLCFASNEMITYIIIFASVMIPLCSVIAVVAGLVAYRTDPLRAKYFITAFFFLMGGIMLIVVKGFGIVLGELNEYGLKFGVAAEVVIFAFALTVRFKQMDERTQAMALEHLQNLNRVKDEYNQTLQEEVARRTEELSNANQKLTDSIRYAKRLQEAVLPRRFAVSNLFPRSSIFEQPRDIVSGDFFWANQIGQTKMLAVVDCTGHGAHGAFMSILGCRLFDEIAEQMSLECPAEWLIHLDRRFRRILISERDETIYAASMDVALLAYNEADQILEYAGARRPLYLFRNGHLQVYKGSPIAIGGTLTGKRQTAFFEKHRIDVQSGDIVYLFSDGYADQFGGQPEQKLTLGRFKEILATIHHHPIHQQEQHLKSHLTAWQQSSPQMDDILVVAVAIS
ncbi:7TM diverse intracellular signaling domain-containing protein [Rhodoflexus caldus]|uniref:7TM diverse intracellular signaling domain-containing protein n=1 Tax=Rhodoflexus caldus TaxID=2891236 RepID=UPI00202A90E3|nr:7TM diverse intracellular signaling domain-containing protein [Rhodoflexus caldus]